MIKRYSITLVIGLLLLLLLVQVGPYPTSAHFNTQAPDTDVQLRWPLDNTYSMSIDLKIVKSPEANASIFWGYQFTFANGEKGFVAIGIGGVPKVATVGVFDATSAATSNPTGACSAGISFLKSGNGYQCFIIYNWNIGFNYGLEFSRITDNSGNEQWEGSILDYSTNSSTAIGDILVSPSYNQLTTNSSTWNEYSTAGSCDTTPTSVIFSHPYALNAAGNHAPSGAQVTYGINLCQDSNVTYLGGGAFQADAGRGMTRTTAPGTWLWTQEPVLSSENSRPTSTTAVTAASTSEGVVTTTTSVTAPASSTPTQPQTVSVTSSGTTPLATTAVPGFPLESILVGLVAGALALGITRNRRRHSTPSR